MCTVTTHLAELSKYTNVSPLVWILAFLQESIVLSKCLSFVIRNHTTHMFQTKTCAMLECLWSVFFPESVAKGFFQGTWFIGDNQPLTTARWWQPDHTKVMADDSCWETLLRKGAEKGCRESSCVRKLLREAAQEGERVLKNAKSTGKERCWERLLGVKGVWRKRFLA